MRTARGVSVLCQRLAARMLILLCVTVIVFVVLRALPADPIGMMTPPGASDADIQALQQSLGLDKPLPVQFVVWLQHALQGQFGNSIQSTTPVLSMLATALPVTLQLVALSLAFGTAAGAAGAIYAFRRRGRPGEAAAELANGIAISIPDFLWGILLMLVFGVGLHWLPFMGQIGSDFEVPRVTGMSFVDCLLAADPAALGSALAHLLLPSIALGLSVAPSVMRMLHSSLLEAYTEDYIQAARLRGLSETRVLYRQAIRNAALPTLNLIGLNAGSLMGGTLLIETIFGLPGIGNLLVSAIGAHDLPVIQAISIIYAVAVQAINASTDTLQIILNPRLRT